MEKILLRQFPPPPESPEPPQAPTRRFGFPDLAWPRLRLPFGETLKFAISLEGPEVRMVAVRGGRIVSWHETTLPPRAIRNGFLVAGQEAGQHIRRVLSQYSLPIGHLRIAIPGLLSTVRVLDVPTTVHINLDSLVKGEARRLLQASPDTNYVFWQKLPTTQGSSVYRVYMVVVPRAPLETTMQSLASAGLKVSSVDLKPLAVARAVNVRDGIIGHADLHGGDVVIVTGGIPTRIHSFYWGDEPQTEEYALIRTADALMRTISSYNDGNREHPLDQGVPVYLTGPLAKNEDLTTTVVQMTGRQVTEPLPPAHLGCPSNFPLQTFTVALGMALKRN